MRAREFLWRQGLRCHPEDAERIDELFVSRFDLVVTTMMTRLRIKIPRVYESVAGETRFYWREVRREVTVLEYFSEKYNIIIPFDTLLIYDEDEDTNHLHPLHLINIAIDQRRQPIILPPGYDSD